MKADINIEFGDGLLYINSDKASITAGIVNDDGDSVFRFSSNKAADVTNALEYLRDKINLAINIMVAMEDQEI